jgi:hypothetical protein
LGETLYSLLVIPSVVSKIKILRILTRQANMDSNAAREPEKVDDGSPKEMQLEHTASDSLEELDPHQHKQLIRKIDWRLLPMLGALYAIALIDRINVCYNHVCFEEKDADIYKYTW